MTWNTPEYYKDVSVRLNRVLDSAGLAEDIRWKRINMLIQSEELLSLKRFQSHFLGSQAEATTTPGLNSDVDCVTCMPIRVVKDLESWVPCIPTLLIVSDKSTPPGYVKLQAVNIYTPRPLYYRNNVDIKLDRHARSVFSDESLKVMEADKYHGPAKRNVFGPYHVDFVNAARLHVWPEQSSKWVTRNRQHNWPSQEIIGLVLETGALLVPVGHKLSEEKHLEWRISMSYGEKILVWRFNAAQYKCYILLKMINKCFIKPVVGDDVLSSYHCKTCMFYLIENTPTSMWQPDNLLLCVELCLRLLYKWIKNAICPNYFIPEKNMFDCKVYGHVQGQLLGILSNLLRQEGTYLVGMSCDNIGQKLVIACQMPVMQFELQSQDVAQVLYISVSFLFIVFEKAVPKLFQIDSMFDQSILDRAFSFRGPRQEVNAILMTFLYSILGSKLASKHLSQESIDQHYLDITHELLLLGSSSDVASGKLKLAAFYLVQDNFDMSEDVLNEIHQNYNYKISKLTENTISEHTLQVILSENLSTTQLLSQYIAFPVIYHRSEIRCTPKALIPEMFHSKMSNQGDENNLSNMVTVDPKFYLFFLEYICYHRQNKRSHKEAALNNMICAILHINLEFMDTALNLLAYCLKQEGKLMNAYNVLSKSMKLTKQDNAAKWQIAFLVNAVFRDRDTKM